MLDVRDLGGHLDVTYRGGLPRLLLGVAWLSVGSSWLLLSVWIFMKGAGLFVPSSSLEHCTVLYVRISSHKLHSAIVANCGCVRDDS